MANQTGETPREYGDEYGISSDVQFVETAIELAVGREDREELTRLHAIAANNRNAWDRLAQLSVDAQTELDPKTVIYG